MNRILYINACTGEGSRTNELAQHLLGILDGQIECVDLYKENIRSLNAEILSKRDELVKTGKTDSDYTRHPSV